AAIRVTPNDGAHYIPLGVAYAGGKYLITYFDNFADPWLLKGQFIKSTNALGGSIHIGPMGNWPSPAGGTLATDGTGFLVVWEAPATNALGIILRARRIGADGAMSTPVTVDAKVDYGQFGVAYNGGTYIVANN